MDPVQTIPQSTNTTAAQSAFAQAATGRTGGTEARTVISSDFETFLKMLTVQMENQDPLNPMDSSEYAMQLATFSSVEQQVLTNDLLQAMSQQLGVAGLTQVSGWVGQRALVQVPVEAGRDPLTVVANTVTYADRADLVVTGRDGRELERWPITVPGGEIGWSPSEGSGAAAQAVSFAVESFSDGASLGLNPASVYAPVREVRMENGVPVIVVPGGASVPSTRVTALRAG